MAEKVINPYSNVEQALLPEPGGQQRMAQDFFRNVKEFQVGFVAKGSIAAPRIMRANFQGLWLGAHIFGTEQLDPRPAQLPINSAPFRVDMGGNVIAASFSVNGLLGGGVNFFDENNVLTGRISGLSDSIVIDAVQSTGDIAFALAGVLVAAFSTGGNLSLTTAGAGMFVQDDGLFGFLTNNAVFNSPGVGAIGMATNTVFNLPVHTADPTVAGVANGSMYYNSTTNKARVREAGAFRDM